MFTNISWLEYITFVFVSLIIYYVIVGLKFYSYALRLMLLRHKKLLEGSQLQQLQPELFASPKKYTSVADDTDDPKVEIEKLTTEIKSIIKEAASQNYIKEEFILSLQILLREYLYLKNSPFFAGINNLIASECEKNGYIKLSAEERVMLWDE